MQTRQNIHFQIFYTLLILTAITIPFTIYCLLPIAILLFLNWLIEGQFRQKFQRIRKNNFTIFFALTFGFFIMHLLGMIYSHNTADGWSNLECKMWFFLAPLIVFTSDKEIFTKEKIHKLFLIFVISTFTVIMINMVLSGINYFRNGDVLSFYYMHLTHLMPSRPMHPSYLAMYVTVSAFYILYLLYFRPIDYSKSIRYICILFLLIFTLFIFLLQSKAGIITYFFLFTLAILYFINYRQKRIVWSVIFILSMGFIIYGLFQFTPKSGNRMQAAVMELSSNIENEKDNPNIEPQSSGQRVMVWGAACKIIKKHPIIGVGTGDVMDNLLEEYNNEELESIYEQELNAHNQYLQTTIAFGIIGFIILVSFLLYPIYQSIKKSNFVFFFFISTIGLHLLVESMFEVRAGANFIPLFYCLLAYQMTAFEKQNILNND